jgi:hypothetical protein
LAVLNNYSVASFMDLLPMVVVMSFMLVIVEDCLINMSVSFMGSMAFLGVGGVVMVISMCGSGGGGILTMSNSLSICVLNSIMHSGLHFLVVVLLLSIFLVLVSM